MLIEGGLIMAEDSYKKGFNTAIKVILGLALIVAGVIAIVAFRSSVITFIKAGIGLVLFLAGAITLAIAKD